MLLGHELHACELRSPHTACAYVADLSGLHEVVQGFHCFFDGDEGVKAVDLKEVDVGGVETAEGGVDCGDDCFSGEAWRVASV